MNISKPTALRTRRAMGYFLTAFVAFSFGALLFSPHIPAQLDDAKTGGTVPVQERILDDARTVELDISTVPAQPLRFAGTGTLTSLTCPSDGIVHSGTPLMKVDGQNVVPLATSTPLWRELTSGMRGEDVYALQTELHRLGLNVSADGIVDTYTLSAVAKLLELPENDTASYSVISPASFLWIPSSSVRVTECSYAVGAQLEAGAEIMTTDALIAAARVRNIPSGAVPGARKLVVDGIDIPLDNEGNVSGEEALAALASTQTYRQWSEDKNEPFRAHYALTEGARVYAVSPAVIYNVKGKHGCVYSANKTRKVEIVSSELGKTFVTFPDGKPAATTVDMNPDTSKACD